MNRIIDAIEKDQFKTELPAFRVGDSVRVHTRVVEGDKERIQIFAGIVIGRKGRGLNESSPSAGFPTAKESSACSRCIRPALRKWKWKKKAVPAAPSSITCAPAKARKRLRSRE